MRARFALGVLAVSTILATLPAAAIELDNGIRQYRDNGGDDPHGNTLFLATTSDKARKAAGLVLHLSGREAGGDGRDIIMGFFKKEDWRDFVALWMKAGNAIVLPGAYSKDIGDLADTHDASRITLVAMENGAVEFRFVAKVDGQYTIRSFDLLPEAFGAFGEDLKTITAYFGK